MTKFEDQLFDDLMREHGSTLTKAGRPAPRRHVATRRALLAVAGGGVAAAAAAGVLVATAGGTTPAYALTTHSNGTITLAVYQKSGIAAANAKLHELGDSQVYVVPVGAGCPGMSSLPAPAVSPGNHLNVQVGTSAGGAVTVDAKGIPAGDILVVAVQTTSNGNARTSLGAGRLTTAPAPSCVSLPAPPAPPGSGVSKTAAGSGSA